MASPARIVILALLFSMFCLGLYDYVANYEKNSCEMTYMFQPPEYLKVPLAGKSRKLFPNYNLYLYAEGKYARESESFKLKGIPVLFIPGNAGSYRQVRSLGSVALKKAADSKQPFHFNYFSLDLNEEFSGLYGGYLQAQTEFAHACIKKIMSLYKGFPSPPKSVIIVGHSMGGMVARALFTLPDFDASLVHTIITQATPHQAPVVALDANMADFYNQVNSLWVIEKNHSLVDVTVISTGGGFRDLLVRSDLTSLRGIVGIERSISTNTMSLPLGWVSTDHLCHVWCKQLVMATSRALFDIVDKNTKQVAVNPVYRLRSFFHHFIHNPGPKKVIFTYDETVKLNPAVKWERRQKSSWQTSKESTNRTRYSVMVVPLFDREQFAAVAISNIANEKWIGGCTASPTEKRCAEMVNFAPQANLLPPMYSDQKVVHITTDSMADFTEIVTVLPKSKKRIQAKAEIYNTTERHLEYNVTSLLGFFSGFPGSVMKEDVIIDSTSDGALFYNITLQGLDIPLQAYNIHITTLQCTQQETGDFAGSVVKLYVPWSSEHTYSFIRPGHNATVNAKLQSGKPAGHPGLVQLHLYLKPSCTYRVTTDIAFTQLNGQFVRFYGVLLPAFLAIQVLMSLSWQLKALDEEGVAPSFMAAHCRWAQPWRVVPLASLVRFMITYPEEDNIAMKLGLPLDDASGLQRQGVWYQALPVILYLTCYSFMALYIPIISFLISAASRVVGVLCARCCASPRVCTLATYAECTLYVCGAVVSYWCCGTAGILTVCALHVVKTLSSHVRARTSERGDTGAWSQHHVTFTLLMLFLVLLLLNAPSLLVWAQNLQVSWSLANDPSQHTGIITCIAALLLKLAKFPTPYSEWYSIMGTLCYFSCILMVLYSSVSLYRVSYFISAILLLISIPSLLVSFAPDTPPKPAVSSKEKTN